ncbi:MAG: hypothetical protein R3B49_06365 [Phycisphaerales bacterium]
MLLVWGAAVVLMFVLFVGTCLSRSVLSSGSLSNDPRDEVVRMYAVWEGPMFASRPHRVSARLSASEHGKDGSFRYFPGRGEMSEWPGGETWPAQGALIGALTEANVLERVRLARPELDADTAAKVSRDIVKMIDRAVRDDYDGIGFNDLYDQLYTDAPPPPGWELLRVWGGGENYTLRAVPGPSMVLPLVPPVLAIVASVFIFRAGQRRVSPPLPLGERAG